MREGIEKGKLSITLRGKKLKGSFALLGTSDGKSWPTIKHKDRFVSKIAVSEDNRSVLSGVTVEDLTTVPAHRIPAERLAANGPLELPAENAVANACRNRRRAVQPRRLDVGAKAGWLSRARVHRSRQRDAAVAPRRARAWTRTFRNSAANSRSRMSPTMIVDGEIVAFDADGQAEFQRDAESHRT